MIYHAQNALLFDDIVVGARVFVPDWRRGTVIGWTNGTVTEEQGTLADKTGCFIVRLDSTGREALYFGYSIGRPIVYAVWHGGASYSDVDGDDYAETFPSLRAAGDALREREAHGHWEAQPFAFVHRAPQTVLVPVVDRATTRMDIYEGDPKFGFGRVFTLVLDRDGGAVKEEDRHDSSL